jgi:hypothetical protein
MTPVKPHVVFVYGKEPYDAYIGRGRCPWTNVFHGTILSGRPHDYGNPRPHKKSGLAEFSVATVEEAVQKFREYCETHPEVIARIKRELRGLTLSCWCKTKKNPNAPCHGDVLVEIANS